MKLQHNRMGLVFEEPNPLHHPGALEKAFAETATHDFAQQGIKVVRGSKGNIKIPTIVRLPGRGPSHCR